METSWRSSLEWASPEVVVGRQQMTGFFLEQKHSKTFNSVLMSQSHKRWCIKDLENKDCWCYTGNSNKYHYDKNASI